MNLPQQNADPFDQFSHYLAFSKSALKQQYDKHLANDLSHQQWQGCFQRNVLAVLELFFEDAFFQVKTLPFDASQYGVNQGMSELTRLIMAKFDGLIDEFLLYVVNKHRTSCALSNFADEHKPDKDYVNEVRHDIAELWKTFAINTNNHFLESV